VRFTLDASYSRHDRVVIGGSPLRLFRLGTAGVRVAEALEHAEDVEPSSLVDRLLDAGAIHPLVEPVEVGHDRITIVTPIRDDAPARSPTPIDDRTATRLRTIVVDDGSDPPLADADVRLDVNAGPAAARNAGLERVETELVAFVDGDVELPERWLEHLLGYFDDPSVGLVAPRVRSVPGEGRLATYERDHSPLDLGPGPARIRAGTRVSYVPAAALVCRTAAVRAVGGFDTGLRFGEDVDLVWRLDAAGWTCRYEPGVEVLHRPRGSWPAWVRQRIGYGSSAAPLARRHPGALAPVRMSGWSAGAWLLGAIGHPVAGTAIGVGSALALTEVLDDVPPDVAFGIAARGNAHAGRTLADAVRRVWWPIVAVAATRSTMARRIALASVMVAGHPLRVVDDLAYGVGVWRGMVRERTIAPLLPRFSSWPGRRTGR
jgi:mycofactocin glycosyltransferase